MGFDNTAALAELDGTWRQAWSPPPRLSVSEHADKYRTLSREAAAEPGRWVTARAEYQREMMDAPLDPNYEGVVIMTSSQVGKTEILLNLCHYFVHMDPCPILLMQPTLEVAEAVSKDRFAPMIRDCDTLRPLFSDKAKVAENSIKHKTFPGGHLTFVGANSPSSLASRPIRVLLADEVDRYPISAGEEGDPLLLGVKRMRSYWNRVRVEVSTPTVKGASRIETDFELSTQDRFWVPCSECGERQVLVWANVKWGKKPTGEHDPATAYYECNHCEAHWDEADKIRAVAQGEWRSDNPGAQFRGFHIWELYSPWSSMASIVTDFLAAKGDRERLQVWTNTTLGESWDETMEQRDPDEVFRTRRSNYLPLVPMRGVLLAAGVDVQKDHKAVEVVAFSPSYETWQMDYKLIPCMPGDFSGLDDYILQTWPHESGLQMPLVCVAVDSGNWADEVYAYCKGKEQRRVWPIKGRGGEGLPAVVSSTTRNKHGVRVFTLGVDGLKRRFYSSLYEVDEPGPRFCNYPMERDAAYFKHLMSERPERLYYRGRPTVRWVAKKHLRQEPLDTRMYAMGAIEILSPVWPAVAENHETRVEQLDKEPEQESVPETPSRDHPVQGVLRRRQRRVNPTTNW